MTNRYFSAEGRLEDDFGVQFTGKKGERVYDAKTRMGPWATMSQSSFSRYGCGRLGTGLGQCYERDESGRLNKIDG